MRERRTSGLEQIPHVFSRPVWKDRFFWLMIATAAGWALVGATNSGSTAAASTMRNSLRVMRNPGFRNK